MNVVNKNSLKNDYDALLFIPKTGKDFEEKRDLIFNQLSINKTIISANKKKENDVKRQLLPILNNIEIIDEVIPEIYDLQLKDKIIFDAELINNKISNIIQGAIILKIKKEKKYSLKINLSIILLTFMLIIFFNYFINRNLISRLNVYLNISRYFGVKDNQVIKNLNLGYFVLLILIFIINYLLLTLMNKFNLSDIFNGYNFLKPFILICLFFLITYLVLFSVQLNYNIKKLNRL
tara:strand:- start:2264 stop:2968 length:705 start_codon:yes stop_codon:yes gene_type:complete